MTYTYQNSSGDRREIDTPGTTPPPREILVHPDGGWDDGQYGRSHGYRSAKTQFPKRVFTRIEQYTQGAA
jgi:hypothetical protein